VYLLGQRQSAVTVKFSSKGLLCTFRVEEGCDSKLLLGHGEGVLQVLHGVGLGQLVVLDQVRPETHTYTHGHRSKMYYFMKKFKGSAAQ